MPGTVLSALCSISLKLYVTRWGGYCHSHFEEITPLRNLVNFLNVIELVKDGVRGRSQVYLYHSIYSLNYYSIRRFLRKS